MTTAAVKDIVRTLGIDLGKNVFYVIGMNTRGAIVLRERLSRDCLNVWPIWRLV
jgi:hypothetical protein